MKEDERERHAQREREREREREGERERERHTVIVEPDCGISDAIVEKNNPKERTEKENTK